jgi:hypothetical protein
MGFIVFRFIMACSAIYFLDMKVKVLTHEQELQGDIEKKLEDYNHTGN